ncbi:hypothetical protein THRCLA_01622, partial [Thraustotheca clavata]
SPFYEMIRSVYEMWTAKLGDVKDDQSKPAAWYSQGADYWEDEVNCPSDVGGVLGGYGYISQVDIEGSISFLKRVQSIRPELKHEYAIDCGGGIGRVVKHLLLLQFQTVDLLEQSPRLLKAAPKYIGDENHRVREYICLGMQDFNPSPKSYDLIWCQWVCPHLTDIDFIDYLTKCQLSLRDGGVICIKENTIADGSPFEVDEEDSSLTRSAAYYKSIFRQAGLTILYEERQRGFPEELYPLRVSIHIKPSFAFHSFSFLIGPCPLGCIAPPQFEMDINWERAEDKSARITSPAMRSGHAAVVLSSNMVLVHGGHAVDRPFTDTWLLSLSSGDRAESLDDGTQYLPEIQWERLHSVRQDTTGYHRHHSMHVVGSTVYVIGNRISPNDKNNEFVQEKHLEIQKFNLAINDKRVTWCNVRCDALKSIPPRFGHSSVLLNDGRIFIFGGQSADGLIFYNDVIIFNTQNETLEYITESDNRPSRRAFAAMTIVNSKVIIHGGFGKQNTQSQSTRKGTLFCNTFEYDLQRHAWRLLKHLQSEGLSEAVYRAKHSMISLTDGFVIFSGITKKDSDAGFLAGHILNDNCSFTMVDCQGVAPQPRNFTTILQLTPRLVICFGGGSLKNPSSFDSGVYVGSVHKKLPPPTQPTILSGKRKRTRSSTDEPEVAAKRPATRRDAQPQPHVSFDTPPSVPPSESNSFTAYLIAKETQLNQKIAQLEQAYKALEEDKKSVEIGYSKIQGMNEKLEAQNITLQNELDAAKLDINGKSSHALNRLLGMTAETKLKEFDSQSTSAGSQDYRVTQAEYDSLVEAHNKVVAELSTLKQQMKHKDSIHRSVMMSLQQYGQFPKYGDTQDDINVTREVDMD